MSPYPFPRGTTSGNLRKDALRGEIDDMYGVKWGGIGFLINKLIAGISHKFESSKDSVQ